MLIKHKSNRRKIKNDDRKYIKIKKNKYRITNKNKFIEFRDRS